MAITYNSTVHDVVQEAFGILRQDYDVPAVESTPVDIDSVSDTSLEWRKARLALKTAANEVFDSFSWGSSYTAEGIESWSAKMRNALVYTLARELAIPIAGRIEDMKVIASLTNDKLLQAKLTALSDALKTNDDEVLTQLLANFRQDDPGLCRAYAVYTQRVTNVRSRSVNEVKETLGITVAGDPTDNLAKAAVTSLCVAKLAPVCGGDANLVQMLMANYNQCIQEYRKQTLNTWLAGNSDPVLAQLVANFKTDDPGLLNVQTVYTQRATTVKAVSDATVKDMLGLEAAATLAGIQQEASYCLSVAKLAPACGLDANFTNLKMQEYQSIVLECKRRQLDKFIEDRNGIFVGCESEVCKTLGIASIGTGASTDYLALACATALCHGRFGERYGYDANYCQLKMQEYSAKVQEWRKVALNTTLASNTDPVLTELLANFRSDDAGLANAFAVYTQRVANVKTTAEAEVNLAHDWRTAFDWDGASAASHPVYPAWIALCASKLAPACGMGADFANLLEQKYQLRLKEARVADLEAAKDALTDTDTKDILAQILGSFSSADAKLPRSISSVTARISNLQDNARRDVLLAHDWNFACTSEEVAAAFAEYEDDEYRFAYVYPKKSLRLVAVFGVRGRLNAWKIENDMIRAKEPITKIRYLRDVGSVEKWSQLAKSLYLMRLKALVSRTVMGNAQDANIQEQLYAAALADAKLHDAKEANMPDDAWGDNHYADAMKGRVIRREPPYFRG